MCAFSRSCHSVGNEISKCLRHIKQSTNAYMDAAIETKCAARATLLGEMSTREKYPSSSLFYSSSQIDAHEARLFSECCSHFPNNDENNSSNEIHWCINVYKRHMQKNFCLLLKMIEKLCGCLDNSPSIPDIISLTDSTHINICGVVFSCT